MSPRPVLYRVIRRNFGTPKRPLWDYFERWEDDWAWWTVQKSKAERFPEAAIARANLHQLRKHDRRGLTSPARIVRIVGKP